MPSLVLAVESQPGGYSGTRLLNVYARPRRGGASGAELVQSSGMERFTKTAMGGPVRALLAGTSFLYAMAGGRFWTINPEGGNFSRGVTVPDDAGATMATDGTTVAVANQGSLYTHAIGSNGFRSQDVATLNSVGSVAFMDQRFVLEGSSGGRRDRLVCSGALDPTSWDGLAFATAEADPDATRRVFVNGAQLWVCGATTIEIWFGTGSGDFPFSRNPGAVLNVGIRNAQSIASDRQGNVFWIGSDRLVYASGGGFSAIEISEPQVVEALKPSNNPRLFTIVDQGDTFVCIRPNDGPAWLYSTKHRLWSERASGVPEGSLWLARNAVFFRGSWYAGAEDGNVYELKDTICSDGDLALRRVWTTEPFENDMQPFSLEELQIDVQTGEHDLGRSPVLKLETSQDGKVWLPARGRNLGLRGNFRRHVAWCRLGRFRPRAQFRLTATDPVRTTIYGATVRT